MRAMTSPTEGQTPPIKDLLHAANAPDVQNKIKLHGAADFGCRHTFKPLLQVFLDIGTQNRSGNNSDFMRFGGQGKPNRKLMPGSSFRRSEERIDRAFDRVHITGEI